MANQAGMAGKYRRDNPELKRIDGTLLEMEHWKNIPNAMSEFEVELREQTKNLKRPKTMQQYRKVINVVSRLSHRLACIHPFENGNGRSSRFLINFIFRKINLPTIAIKAAKPRYLRAMCQADYGDFNLLEELILEGLINAQNIKINEFKKRKKKK